MIYTITFNPSIDYILKVEDFKLGEVNRANLDSKYPGGKGINVSRVLNNLNVKTKALGFIGGFTGEYIKNYLEKGGVETDFINVCEDTRINVKIKISKETEINAAGPKITNEDLNKLFEKIVAARKDDFIVLAGNVQKDLPRDIYAKFQEKCANKSAKFVIDTTGEALMCTLKNKPFLIKPNVEELSEIFNTKINDVEEIILYGSKLLEMGAQNVVISMASKGAILICKEGVYHASAPKGIVKNSVGAGDSLIGGFLANYSTSFNVKEAFKWGAAAGSATAFSLDLCTKREVEELLEQVKITKIT